MEYLPIREHLSEIDMIIGKPGGAIMSECIATDTPLLIPEYLPGQEEGNMQLLKDIHMGIYENSAEKMFDIIVKNRWKGGKYERKNIANKYACRDIYEAMQEI